MLFQGLVKPPWDIAWEDNQDQEAEESEPIPEILREKWLEASSRSFEDQLYLISSHTAHRELDILDWETQKRVLYVLRILDQQELEEKRFKLLVDVLIKTRQ